jgi:hypothetical protein
MRAVTGAMVLAMTLSGCAGPGAAPPIDLSPVADVRGLMVGLTEPAADVIWQSVGTIITREGRTDRAPRTDAEWDEVRLAAMVLVESANLLLVEGRVDDLVDWPDFTADLIATGVETIRAVEARDADAVLTAGGRIYDACAACHQAYLGGPGL